MRYESELYHHGILGQKWGHKNGPPYPLDSDDHSTSEKKAGWRKSVSSKPKTYVKSSKKEKKEFHNEYNKAIDSAYDKNELHKLDEQIEKSYNEGDIQKAYDLEDEYDRIRDMSVGEARNYMVDKYGEGYVKSYEDYQSITGEVAGTAAIVVGLGLTVATIYGSEKVVEFIGDKTMELEKKVVEEVLKKVMK